MGLPVVLTSRLAAYDVLSSETIAHQLAGLMASPVRSTVICPDSNEGKRTRRYREKNRQE